MNKRPPKATVAFVPREQFSTTKRCLDVLMQRTTEPFELVVVDGGSPADVKEHLAHAAREFGFTLVRTEEYLTPNQARNLALQHVHTDYVVFVDNDVLVSQGWLHALVDCANATDAWVVGPLYFEFEPEGKRIHMFGGEVDVKNHCNELTYVEKHYHAHELFDEARIDLVRQRTNLVEFHSVLIRMDVFDRIGTLDEGLVSNSEHGDLCMSVRKVGGTIWLEPSSQITYAPPKSLSGADREFFLLRWSEARGAANRKHLAEKYGIHPNSKGMKQSARWLAQHRRYSITWLNRWKKRLGPFFGKRLEKNIVTPLERTWNRHQYPTSRFGIIQTPTVLVTNSKAPELNSRVA